MVNEQVKSILVDWGSTSFRAWAVSEDGQVLESLRSERGMAGIAAAGGDFETELLNIITAWLDTRRCIPITACGMVGARNGWIEAPYDIAPCPPQTRRIDAPVRSDQIQVSIHAGVQQTSPADVMRGEETIISGLVVDAPHFDGTVCLPGTHSKWVRVKQNQIDRFRTFMTGEMFAILSKHSLLQHSLSPSGLESGPFLKGVERSIDDPARILNSLFQLRADSLIHQTSDLASRSMLSGLLVGLELAGAREFGNLADVALIAAGDLATIYELGLKFVGCQPTLYDPQRLALNGLLKSNTQL